MPEIGWVKIVHKVPDFPAIPVPGNMVWTPLLRIEYADIGGVTRRDLGPAILGGELGAVFPTTLPKDVKVRWNRVTKDDPTEETGLVVGTARAWTALIPAGLEFLTFDDFPLDLELRHNAATFPVSTVVAAIYVPMLYEVSRLTIGVD